VIFDGLVKMKKWLKLAIGGCVAAACSASGGNRSSDLLPGEGTGGGSSIVVGNAGSSSFADVVVPTCSDACQDFPAAAIIDSGAPANAAALFGDPSNSTSGGLCILEPQAGSLFPANWLRPRIRFSAPAGLDLFEIRLSTPKEANHLVVYTKENPFKLPQDIWQGLATNVHEEDITVAVRAVSSSGGGTPVGAESSFKIAPVSARGSMVYWATTSTQKGDAYAWLDGFGVGEEGVVVALRQPQVTFSPMRDMAGNIRGAEFGAQQGRVSCIGCHTSTPDGNAALFDDHWPWGIAIASVLEGSVGQTPDYVTPAGQAALSQAWLGVMATSTAYWSGDRHLVVTSFGGTRTTGFGTVGGPNGDQIGENFSIQPNARLAWINVSAPGSAAPATQSGYDLIRWLGQQQGTAYGFITRTGDTRGAMTPDWSDDGSTIVYVSTVAGRDGRLATGEADLYSVPFNDGQGGTATPIAGASEAGVAEYYPAISPDGKLVAFNRVGNVASEMYYNSASEVFVVPAAGGTALRLEANSPVSCLNVTSPGVINSWPKWSPLPISTNGRTYYWLIFSSAREPSVQIQGSTDAPVKDPRGSQLYITAVVVEGDTIETYPAIYLWNQRTTTSNHTPAWDVFHIPPVPVY
jgi:hypothetical protein